MNTLLTFSYAGDDRGSRGRVGASVSKSATTRRVPNGFSLVELLITLAVIAIVIAVAVPDIINFNQTYRIRNDADRLASLVNLARMRSVGTFARVQVSCSTTTNQCSLLSKPYTATVWTADANAQTVDLSQGVSFGIPSGVSVGVGGQSGVAPYQGSKAQTIADAMIFNSRGLPIVDNTGGTAVSDYALYLVGPNNTAMAISADASGKSYIYTLNGSSWVLATN